jgi:large subunit ribosomal protein L7e
MPPKTSLKKAANAVAATTKLGKGAAPAKAAPAKAAPAKAAAPKKVAAASDGKKVVPEYVQKKRARDLKYTDALKAKRDEAKKARVAKRADYLKKGTQYFEENAAEAKRVVDELRKAKAAGNYYVPAEPKVALVIRIRG